MEKSGKPCQAWRKLLRKICWSHRRSHVLRNTLAMSWLNSFGWSGKHHWKRNRHGITLPIVRAAAEANMRFKAEDTVDDIEIDNNKPLWQPLSAAPTWVDWNLPWKHSNCPTRRPTQATLTSNLQLQTSHQVSCAARNQPSADCKSRDFAATFTILAVQVSTLHGRKNHQSIAFQAMIDHPPLYTSSRMDSLKTILIIIYNFITPKKSEFSLIYMDLPCSIIL